MPSLSDDEIRPGVVGWLDQVSLNSNDAVLKTTPYLGDPEPRPFICFDRDGETSSWAPITTQHRKERLFLDAGWRSGGPTDWRKLDQYLVDGANTYVGPNAEFIAVSGDDFCGVGARRALSPDGVAAVVAEVKRQEGRQRAT